jgi:hypothetical protein
MENIVGGVQRPSKRGRAYLVFGRGLPVSYDLAVYILRKTSHSIRQAKVIFMHGLCLGLSRYDVIVVIRYLRLTYSITSH